MLFFAAGIISALGALFLELFFSLFEENFLTFYFFGASFFPFLAVVIEEFLKLVFLNKLLEEKVNSKSLLGKIVFFGLGFSILEITLNIFKLGELKISMILPYSGVFLIHVATALLIGWFILNKNKNYFWMATGFSLAIFLHFLYNLAVLKNYNQPFLTAVILVISFFFFKKIRAAGISC